MKTHLLSSMVFILTFLLSPNLKAQIPAIDSLRIIPECPTTTDSVKVISFTTFPSGGCAMSANSVTAHETTLAVFATHTLGPLTYICSSADTLAIGLLGTGTYTLYYHLIDELTPSITHDIDTLVFTVQSASAIENNYISEQKITAYPNPSSATITIELKSESTDLKYVDLYSLLGQKIKSLKTEKSLITFDVSGLNDGIYIISVYNERIWWIQKILKETAPERTK